MYSIQGRRRAHGKSLSTLMIAVILATQLAMLVGPSVAHATNNVTICHKNGNSWQQQSVSQSSLSGHLNHGDFVVDAQHPCPPADTCGAQFSYTKDDHDFEDHRVDIDLKDYQGDNDRQVVITPKSGYKLISIGIDYEDSDANEATPSVGSGLSAVTYTAPNNESIDHVTVVVEKVCPDLCPNIPDSQYTIPEGYIVNEEGQCVPPPTDVCPNINGAQETVPEGYQITDGQCVVIPPPPVDVCPNLDGAQSELPAGYYLSEGQCQPVPEEPTDMCPNIEEVQETVPSGYEVVEGNCELIPPPPVDVCPNLEGNQETLPESYEIVEGGCVQIPPPVVDVCLNLEGDQTSVPQGYESLSEGDCTLIPAPEVCPEGTTGTYPDCEEIPDVQEDVDLCPEEGLQNELPCASVTPEPETTTTGSGGGGGGNGPIAGTSFGGPAFTVSAGGGSVLGTSTVAETAPVEACAAIITSFMRMGKESDPEQVKVLQSFLNKELGLSLEVDGVFGQETHDAVVAFQLKYSKEVLGPWGISVATGYVFKTTSRWINMLSCSTLEIPMPELN